MSISLRHKVKSQRELIVVLKPEIGMLDYEGTPSPASNTIGSALLSHLSKYGAKIKPILRRRGENSLSPMRPTETNEALQHLARYHSVSAPANRIDELKASLLNQPAVETAYIKPPGEPPAINPSRLTRPSANTQTTTPDFTVRQDYLGTAPVGVDARYAWTLPGGRGMGVNIIDCEWSWNFAHEDLTSHCGGVVVGIPGASEDDHGTSVIGSIIGNDNGFGITGIAPDATLEAAAFDFDCSDPKCTSTIIIEAADHLSAGDLLLLEIHRPGPRTPTPQPESDQQGYIAIEWWPDDFYAIAHATAKGIIVIEAAGNGSEDLDNPDYDIPDPNFPAGWRNPFASGGPNSGAILVGAGNPPSGTHGRTQDTYGFNETYVDRARCIFSNYGSRVDCQGWGWEVTTLGSGDLQPGNTNTSPSDHNVLYTDVFGGTSSASPIITGVLACIQGALQASGRPLLTPGASRNLLRTTGFSQQSAPGRPSTQRIGSRPDLKEILGLLLSS